MTNREFWIKEARRYERKVAEIREEDMTQEDSAQLIYLSRVIGQCWLNAGDADQDELRIKQNQPTEG